MSTEARESAVLERIAAFRRRRPRLTDEIVTLAHGAGGKSSAALVDAVFLEAAEYDDGFAKIVHGAQPVSQNVLAEDPDGFAPLTDIGIRLAWDDEQILIWQNRQLKEDPTVPPVPGQPPGGVGRIGHSPADRDRRRETERTRLGSTFIRVEEAQSLMQSQLAALKNMRG